MPPVAGGVALDVEEVFFIIILITYYFIALVKTTGTYRRKYAMTHTVTAHYVP
jgi:hypothetical protein